MMVGMDPFEPGRVIVVGGGPAGFACGRKLSAGGASLRKLGEVERLSGLDLVVPTRPMLAVSGLADALKALPGGPPVFEIGDCVMPRTAFEAMQDAAALGHRL